MTPPAVLNETGCMIASVYDAATMANRASRALSIALRNNAAAEYRVDRRVERRILRAGRKDDCLHVFSNRYATHHTPAELKTEW